MDDVYYVWRRSDGYVGCSAGHPPWNGRDTFDVLLETADWAEARDRIVAEREADALTKEGEDG